MEECIICTFNKFIYELPCCQNKICLNCAKTVTNCPYCTATIDKQLVTDPKSVKKYGDLLYRNLPEIVWLYSGRNNGWWIYDQNQLEVIESEYLKGTKKIKLFICGHNIKLNFTKMKQINTDNKAVRDIIRIPFADLKNTGLLIKGVDGMQ